MAAWTAQRVATLPTDGIKELRKNAEKTAQPKLLRSVILS
jgi:hypothetical protein